MSRRIQAYFRTEDEAEGAKTALIPYGVDNLEVSPLTDPLKTDGNYRNNILIPLVPYNNSAMTGGAFGATGAVAGSGPIAGAPIVPAIDVNDGPDDLDNRSAGDVRTHGEFDDRDMDDLRYVMEVKVADGKQDEVIEALRRKRAYVEIFD
jgi:hypothetical protein